MGRKQFSTDGGEATRDQTNLQQQNAAVQTTLTLALLVFSYLQVVSPIFPLNSDFSFIIFGVLTIIATTATAITLWVGGGNLVEVMRERYKV